MNNQTDDLKRDEINFKIDEKERLSNSLQSMGTTFIKLGQFLATRPDIIGEDLSKQLESLQDLSLIHI